MRLYGVHSLPPKLQWLGRILETCSELVSGENLISVDWKLFFIEIKGIGGFLDLEHNPPLWRERYLCGYFLGVTEIK